VISVNSSHSHSRMSVWLEHGSARRKITRLFKEGLLMDVSVLQQFCKDNIEHITFAVCAAINTDITLTDIALMNYRRASSAVAGLSVWSSLTHHLVHHSLQI
jgi:hypothetical protein